MNLTDKELYYKHNQIKNLHERLITIIKINGKKIILGLAIALGVSISPIVASASTSHTVASGDSLWKISQEYGVTMNSIVNSNPAKLSSTTSVIFPNEVLEIPTGNTNYNYSSEKSNTATYTAPQATYAQSASSYSKPAQSYSQPVTTNSTEQSSANSYTSNDSSSDYNSSAHSSDANQIAQAESGGSYTAENGQYYGKYQLDKSYLHGDYSPENQDRVFVKYCNQRYGSVNNALSFRESHGWY